LRFDSGTLISKTALAEPSPMSLTGLVPLGRTFKVWWYGVAFITVVVEEIEMGMVVVVVVVVVVIVAMVVE
jgi:hypothetical protein